MINNKEELAHIFWKCKIEGFEHYYVFLPLDVFRRVRAMYQG